MVHRMRRVSQDAAELSDLEREIRPPPHTFFFCTHVHGVRQKIESQTVSTEAYFTPPPVVVSAKVVITAQHRKSDWPTRSTTAG